MPLTHKGEEILRQLEQTYGSKERAERVLYAMRNSGKLTGIEDSEPAPAAPPIEPSYVNAAGVLFVAEDGHVLLMHRTDGSGWAFPGGGIEAGENPEQAARREVLEETGFDYSGALHLHTRRIDDAADFTTFIAVGVPKFIPVMNAEHDGFQWVERQAALATLKLHPGVPIALVRPDLDELGVAKAIAAGELTSPQIYGNLLLIAMRVTGTGAAHRSGTQDKPTNEFTYRDPDLYLNDEFLQRCAGLAVLVEHSEGNLMTSEEYAAHNVGSAFYPYIKGDEVWCIAKIMDTAAVQMLLEKQLSTSPGVFFRSKEDCGEEFILPDGAKLLIESKPRQLDHLAICRRGVWDKGGDPAGVDTSGVINMADTQTAESKMDAMMSKMDAACAKMDTVAAEWQAKKDAEAAKAKKDAEEADAKSKKDCEEAAAKKDAADKEEAAAKAKKDADEAQAKKDAERDQQVASLREELAAVRAGQPAKHTPDDKNKFAAAQMRLDSACQAWGHAARPALNGESLRDYRVAILTELKAHSRAYKDSDLSSIGDENAFTNIEGIIINDAIAASNVHIAQGAPLSRRTRVNEHGHKITTYHGDSGIAWAAFMGGGTQLGRINPNPGR
jgi:8-oxo-dGTP pyrophosphatase MutT (NUDIX family)